MGRGRAQLTLVEHALCPLDTAAGLVRGRTHRSAFYYLDAHRHRQTATAEVLCPLGLSPSDEFYLWGLMALALAQPEPGLEFYATPHYCLTELGVIAPAPGGAGGGARGGKNYALFRQSITRLAAVTYLNDRFYDPIRGEHRSVAFGFLSYSLPPDPASSRAWRIVWDPIFFEFCQAVRGSLVFDLELYRSLDFASRRLFLLLKKIFHRNPSSPAFDLRHLGVHVLGFAPSIDVWNLKSKLAQVIRKLAERELIALPPGTSRPAELFEKTGVGQYVIRFQRGPYFEKPPAAGSARTPTRSALHDPLAAIGFEEAAIRRIETRYKTSLIQVWTDITLAAMEKGADFFTRGPQAYFLDNIAKAAQGTRTPPDWWYEHRKAERKRLQEPDPTPPGQRTPSRKPDGEHAFAEYLRTEAREEFGALIERLCAQYETAGQPRREAARHAEDVARLHMRHHFRQAHPESESDTPPTLGEVLRRLALE